jgi:hypothetical protein
METIFISIASYRDQELEKTIQDCLRKAMHPERLVFGIHWQHDNHDFLEQSMDRRFRFIDTYYKESKGACWARHEAQKLYDGEDYVLQIDSHMRFAHGWDVICVDGIKWLQQKGNRKVLFSSIPPGYDPENDGVLRDVVLVHRLGDFNKDGIISIKSSQVRETAEPFSPGQSIAAGFVFGIGDLYREVIIDPDLYFWGEEITYAVRAYTYGYDLYYSHRPIVYHYYARSGNRRHWGDHQGWYERDQQAKARVRSLLMETGEVADLGPYGLGTARTLADYEQYAGVDFKKRMVEKSGNGVRPRGGSARRAYKEDEVKTKLRTKQIGVAQIDPFSYCNAACWYCPVRYYPQPEEARQHMPTPLLEKIVKDLSEEKSSQGIVSPRFNFIYTSHYNEILLYKHLAEMFEIFRRYNMKSMVLTNGIALSKDKVDLLREYDDVVGGCVCLNISAFEPEKWIRQTLNGSESNPHSKGDMFHSVMDNVRYASQQLRGVSIQVNEPDPVEADKQADIGSRMFPGLNIHRHLSLSDRAGILHEAGVVSNRTEIELQSAGSSRVTGCRNTLSGVEGRHYGWLHVNALGKAILCCNDYHFDYTFGDFSTSTLREVWLSKGHVEVIKESFDAICRKCSMATWTS